MRSGGKLRAGFLVAGAGRGRREVQRGQGARRQVRRDRLQPHHQRRELLPARSSRGRGWAPTTSITTAPATWPRCSTRSAGKTERAGHDGGSVHSARPCWWSAPIWRSSIRSSPSRSAPTTGITARTSTRSRAVRCARTSTPSRSVRASSRAGNSPRVESCATQLKAEPELVILFGDAIQGRRAAQAGRVRRFARHPGQVRLPGGLLEFARRHRHGLLRLPGATAA